ncbi:unnamed protein product [Phytomonas sp. Hart1]|nr:unnamed protein product [Phytomonas sp. Hart1]|eukprot:CCW67417.1 unnamed protein product [Phytomonas sp. isolate Hart1]
MVPGSVGWGGGTPYLRKGLVGLLVTFTMVVFIWRGLSRSYFNRRRQTKDTPDKGIHENSQDVEEDNLFTFAGPPRLFASRSEDFHGENSPPRPSAALEGREACTASVPLDAKVRTNDIIAREKKLNLARALLRRVEGVEYEETSDDETPSDETDVSLNYYTATELELKSRDELMEAFSYYQNIQQNSVESAVEKDGQAAFNDMGIVLAKIVEYLDISNEREKLRVRREAKRYDDRTKAFEGLHSFSDDKLPQLSEALPDPGLHARDSWLSPAPDAIPSALNQLNMLDRMLEERDTDEEAFEENWSNGDKEAEAFMEYLQQDDAALKFFTREEVRRNRQNRLRPASQNCIDDDVHVVASDGQNFNDVLAAISGEKVSETDDDFNYDLYDEDIPVEEKEEPTNSWSNSEKAEFEANLSHYLHSLSEAMGVTGLLVEREALQFDAENERRREARRQLTTKQVKRKPLNNQRGNDNSEDEWEDTDDDN